MVKITIVGGAGAIGGVHAWMLAASGHEVTILDSRPDEQTGKSYAQMASAPQFSFRFLEIDDIEKALPAEGETAESFKARFVGFPHIFLERLEKLIPKATFLYREQCVQIIDQITTLDKNAIRFAQRSQDVQGEQDIIEVVVKGGALTGELGDKIHRIPKNPETPVVVFANGIQPWIKPEPGFGNPHLESIQAAYECMERIGLDFIVAGVLIKYGAIIEGDGRVRVRSPFLKTQNVIADATDVGITPGLENLAQFYTDGGLKTTMATPEHSIREVILGKLGYNIYGSIMGAIFGQKFGELANHPATAQAVRDCAREFYAGVKQLGVLLAPNEEAFVTAAIQALVDNCTVISSPLQDIWNGRPTEKTQLLGAMIELAKQSGMQAPVLEAMYQLISKLESVSLENINTAKVLQQQFLQQLPGTEGGLIKLSAEAIKRDATSFTSVARMIAESRARDGIIADPGGNLGITAGTPDAESGLSLSGLGLN